MSDDKARNVLKQLYDSDDDAQPKAAAEQSALKASVMNDLYAGISDDEDDEDEVPSGLRKNQEEAKNPSPGKKSSPSKKDEDLSERAKKNIEEMKEKGSKMATMFKGFFREKVKELDEVKEKLSATKEEVSQSSSDFFSKMKQGMEEMAEKAAEKKQKILDQIQSDSDDNQDLGNFLKDPNAAEEEKKEAEAEEIGNHFLISDDEDDDIPVDEEKLNSQKEEEKTEEAPPSLFKTDDPSSSSEDDDPGVKNIEKITATSLYQPTTEAEKRKLQPKEESKQKEQTASTASTAASTASTASTAATAATSGTARSGAVPEQRQIHEDAETFDESSDDEEEPPPRRVFTEIAPRVAPSFHKGQLLEESEATTLQPLLVRKEVKNANLVRNLVSAFEDRYLAVVDLKQEHEHKSNFKLVVLKKWLPGQEKSKSSAKQLKFVAKALVKTTKAQISNSISKQMKNYKQAGNMRIDQQTGVLANPYEGSSMAEAPKQQLQAPVEDSDSEEEQPITSRPHYEVKSVIALDRIFMINVAKKGVLKSKLQLLLHFVNADRNPKALPKIKQYTISTGEHRLFLQELQRGALACSPYYRQIR